VKAATLEVMGGGMPMSRSVARKALVYFKPTPATQADLLSPRERSVLGKARG
jgi:DNA-binding NarL/FixJ family response regulator